VAILEKQPLRGVVVGQGSAILPRHEQGHAVFVATDSGVARQG